MGDDLISQNRNGAWAFYHYDGLGSTRRLSNAAGVVTDAYDYEAFGETLNKTGTTANAYLFTGEQFDSSLNQYYLRARYYDQGIGRFSQMDTYQGNNADPVTLHKYLYANANPANYTDPSGNTSLAEENIVMGEMTSGGGMSLPGLMGRAAANDATYGAANDAVYAAATSTSPSTSLMIRNLVKVAIGLGSIGERILRKLPPILVHGSELPEHSWHILQSQMGFGDNLSGSPAPTFLKYRLNGRKKERDSWYDSYSPCKETKGKRKGISVCDEYPFISTYEGGEANYKLPIGQVSLRILPDAESKIQFKLTEQFYRKVFNNQDGGKFISLPISIMPSGFTDTTGKFHLLQ